MNFRAKLDLEFEGQIRHCHLLRTTGRLTSSFITWENTVRVTDHAVLRYMERHLELDVEAVREELAHYFDSPKSKQAIEFAAGARCNITVGGQLTGCFQEGMLITCYSKSKRMASRSPSRGPSRRKH